ncbi:putative ABC transporter ATP-binding protein YxlF [Paenibacillus auburnensis]|uniref:ABC transporter ATP-binding protein YxlF n=1 Tax=Paenibacillus auburnensis TaxID=2905649 RepID=A0ABM9CSJ8_9BACL|nr:ABC transporter ATP-binding protein [Paenibacillus auburnensis]CAH1222396.1 putative ABC transporter ATP-binding protein YxlF [Paenibacillus auburnensis]
MTLLEVTGLSKSYGKQRSVDNISFVIEAGQCVALLGPNGAGKTTTLRMLAGLLPPSAGQISFNGSLPGTDYRKELGYLPQSPAMYRWMSGLEYVVFAAKLSGIPSREAAKVSAAALERVGLAAAGRRRIGGYSGGMKQRLGLAQALVHRPKLLLLDEPVSALDPIGRREVMELLREIRGETTVIFSTHVLHDAEEICDNVILMNQGTIAVQGELSELRQQYSLPVIRLSVETGSAAAGWLESLALKPFIQASQISGGKAVFNVADVALARRAILQEAVGLNIPLLHFEAGSSTLEDLFMKVVGS